EVGEVPDRGTRSRGRADACGGTSGGTCACALGCARVRTRADGGRRVILLLGCGLGLGMLLVASPFLWPAARGAGKSGSGSAPGILQGLRERMRQAGLRSVSLAVF